MSVGDVIPVVIEWIHGKLTGMPYRVAKDLDGNIWSIKGNTDRLETGERYMAKIVDDTSVELYAFTGRYTGLPNLNTLSDDELNKLLPAVWEQLKFREGLRKLVQMGFKKEGTKYTYYLNKHDYVIVRLDIHSGEWDLRVVRREYEEPSYLEIYSEFDSIDDIIAFLSTLKELRKAYSKSNPPSYSEVKEYLQRVKGSEELSHAERQARIQVVEEIQYAIHLSE